MMSASDSSRSGNRVAFDLGVREHRVELRGPVLVHRDQQLLAAAEWYWITPHVTPARRAILFELAR